VGCPQQTRLLWSEPCGWLQPAHPSESQWWLQRKCHIHMIPPLTSPKDWWGLFSMILHSDRDPISSLIDWGSLSCMKSFISVCIMLTSLFCILYLYPSLFRWGRNLSIFHAMTLRPIPFPLRTVLLSWESTVIKSQEAPWVMTPSFHLVLRTHHVIYIYQPHLLLEKDLDVPN